MQAFPSCCRLGLLFTVVLGVPTARILLLRSTSLVAPQHVGYSRIRDQTHAPWIGKWILNYWTTREIHDSNFKVVFLNTLGVLGVGWGEC